MLRILIVEDEPPILRAISAAVKNVSGGDTDVETAFNGRAALDKLKSAKPQFDLVITDIRMPVMDGLALAETIYSEMPEVSCAVISGYNDFDYVQSALRSHVCDYLLKPPSEEALGKLIERVRADSERKNREKHESMLKKAISTPAADEETQGERAEKYAPLLLCAGAFPMVADDTLLPGRHLWSTVDIGGVFEKILERDSAVTLLDGKTPSEKIAVIETSDAKCGRETAFRLFSFFEERGLIANIVYSENLCGFGNLGGTLNQMRVRLQNGARFLNLALLKNPDAPVLPVLDDARLKSIDSAVKSGDKAALCKAVEEAVENMVALEATQNQVSHYFKGIISDNRRHFGLGEKEMQSYFYDVDYSISNTLSQGSFCENMVYILSDLAHSAVSSAENEAEPAVIAKIEDYLKLHYKEELTNSRLSAVFGFVPSYLSRLFRTYRGVSPSEYLVKYRIGMAIKYMNETPDMLIKEAAANVGLKDQYYFSKLFKKETGMSPSDYFKGARQA